MGTRICLDVFTASLKSFPCPAKEDHVLNEEFVNKYTVAQFKAVDFEAIAPSGKYFVMDSIKGDRNEKKADSRKKKNGN